MILSTADLSYIDNRLESCDIKYQEIYDEIRDHVISAIETARINGDQREIEMVYDDMMAVQFPGYYAFERIAIAYEKAYRTKINKAVWSNVRHYLSPLNVIVMILAITAGYNLPENKATYIILLVVLLIVAVLPIIYARIKSAGIKTDQGRQSIVREYVANRAALLFVNYYFAMVAVDFFTHDGHFALSDPDHQNPTVNLFVMAFAVVYGLSIGRLCKQEIKIQPLGTNQ